MQPFRLRHLLLYFLKLGATGFGGPIALVGYMQKELVEEKKWFLESDFRNGLALAQLFPGPLASQLAIYFGYLKGKIVGATLVAIFFALPSFIIIVILAHLYLRYQNFPWVPGFLYGMNASTIGVILCAAYKIGKISLDKRKGLWVIFITLALTTILAGKASFLLFCFGGLFATVLYAFPKKEKLFSLLPLDLFFFFFKAALVVYGGGLAVIPFIYGDVVERFQWLTHKEFLDAVAAGMITPGPVLIAVGFMGYLVDGLKGALACAAGVFAPVYLFVILFAPWFHKIVQNIYVKSFVTGVTAAAAGAIAGSVYLLGKNAIVDYWTLLIGSATLLLALKSKIPSPFLIFTGGLLGILLKTLG